MDTMGITPLTPPPRFGTIRGMKHVIPALLSVAALASAMPLLAASERIIDFGGADTSAANTFWNVSGYGGVSVWRSAYVLSGFDSRSRTCAASRGIPLRAKPAGAILIFR